MKKGSALLSVPKSLVREDWETQAIGSPHQHPHNFVYVFVMKLYPESLRKPFKTVD